MLVVEKLIQKIRPSKWAELEELDKKYSALEKEFGFPPKKRYQSIVGEHDSNTLIIMRQWESLAEMEATYGKAFANEEYQKLGQESLAIVKSSRMELYTPLP